MADVTTFKTAKLLHRVVDVGDFVIRNKITTASGTAASGDYIKVVTIGAPLVLLGNVMCVSATLGASCTVQLFHNRAGTRTALTAASTAAAAGRLLATNTTVIELAIDDDIEIAVAGANITAAAIIDVMLTCARV